MNKEEIRDLLYRSMDTTLSKDEQALLDKGLAIFPFLSEEKKQLLSIRSSLKDLTPSRSPAFVDAVMGKIEDVESNEENGEDLESILVYLFPKAIAACFAFVVLSAIYLYYIEGVSTMDTFTGVDYILSDEAISFLQ